MPHQSDPLRPASFPRRIVVATLGLAPQVLTETLWCLATAKEPFVPDEIHIVTTSEGRERAILTLLDPSTARLAELAREIRQPRLAAALKPEHILVISDGDGRPLSDIDSDADNAAAANLISSLVRRLTADPTTAVHASIAGGRKTMGFLLGYALSVFARPQDRLSHVLVSDPFTALPDFFFPPAKPRVLTVGTRPISTSQAELVLAEIPIIRLRDGLPIGLLDEARSYSQIVEEAQARLAVPSMIVDLSSCTLICHERPVTLPPAHFALAALLAERVKALGPEGGALHWTDVDWKAYLSLYSRLPGATGESGARIRKRITNKSGSAISPDDAEAFFRETTSRIRGALARALGQLALIYDLTTFGDRPKTRTGFALDPRTITIRDSGR